MGKAHRKEIRKQQRADVRAARLSELEAAFEEAAALKDPAQAITKLDGLQNDVFRQQSAEMDFIVGQSVDASWKTHIKGLGAAGAVGFGSVGAGLVVATAGLGTVAVAPIFLGTLYASDKRRKSVRESLQAEARNYFAELEDLQTRLFETVDALITPKNAEAIAQSPFRQQALSFPLRAEKFAEASGKKALLDKLPALMKSLPNAQPPAPQPKGKKSDYSHLKFPFGN
jgi:hypothetical protein